MQGLRQLTLPLLEGARTCDRQHLPSSLTQLYLEGTSYPYQTHAASLLQLPQQLSGLLSLSLQWCDVLPAVLGSVTQLQRLCLWYCSLLPYVPHAEYDTEGTAALLDILPKLTCLHELGLRQAKLDTVSIAPQRFSALTASSHLTRLAFSAKHGRPIPPAAVRHMFPAGRQSPQLRELEFNSKQFSDQPDAWFLDSAELGTIISACPGLQDLSIRRAVKPGADLSALLRLPQSCTCLSVGGEALQRCSSAHDCEPDTAEDTFLASDEVVGCWCSAAGSSQAESTGCIVTSEQCVWLSAVGVEDSTGTARAHLCVGA